jgi:hypothetical protein
MWATLLEGVIALLLLLIVWWVWPRAPRTHDDD